MTEMQQGLTPVMGHRGEGVLRAGLQAKAFFLIVADATGDALQILDRCDGRVECGDVAGFQQPSPAFSRASTIESATAVSRDA
jgi:hypothetical protein